MRFGDVRRELDRQSKLAMCVMASFLACSASPFLLRRRIRRSMFWRAAAVAKEAGKAHAAGEGCGFGDARRRRSRLEQPSRCSLGSSTGARQGTDGTGMLFGTRKSTATSFAAVTDKKALLESDTSSPRVLYSFWNAVSCPPALHEKPLVAGVHPKTC